MLSSCKIFNVEFKIVDTIVIKILVVKSDGNGIIKHSIAHILVIKGF